MSTLIDHVTSRLGRLASAAGLHDETEGIVAVFRRLVAPWAERDLSAPWAWTSEIADDNTPIELSVAIGERRAEVRVLFEPQGDEPTVASFRRAGLALHERLEADYGVDLSRFRAVQGLFLPEHMEGPFAVWSSVVFARGHAPAFKAYFNPQARGPGAAPALVEEALGRLGLGRAWATLSHTVARRGPHLDELKYFALDLSNEENARIKVYVRHHAVTAGDLEYACSGARSYRPGEGLAFARAMRGRHGAFDVRAAFTCSAFQGGDERPSATTLYVPVCAYARDDATVARRVSEYVRGVGGDPGLYEAILRGFADRPLDAGVGMQSWVALRRLRGEQRLTVYLSTEASRVHPPGSVPAATGDRTAFDSAEAALRCIRGYDLALHPFVRRLDSEPNARAALWLLVRNIHEGAARRLAGWLKALVARIDDQATRDLLRTRLAEELARHDMERAATERCLGAIDAPAARELGDEALFVGRYLGDHVTRHYDAPNPLEGLGALVASQLGSATLMRAAMRRLGAPLGATERSVLERFAHADEALDADAIARRVPRDRGSIDAVWRGASGVHLAFWHSLDDLYELCFGEPRRELSRVA